MWEASKSPTKEGWDNAMAKIGGVSAAAHTKLKDLHPKVCIAH